MVKRIVLFSFLFFPLVSFAQTAPYNNSSACNGTLVTTTLSYNCTGTQDLPDDGNGYIPVTVTNNPYVFSVPYVSYSLSVSDPVAIFSQYGIDGLVFSSTTSYTVLGLVADIYNVDTGPYIQCSSGSASTTIGFNIAPVAGEAIYSVPLNMHCDGDLYFISNGGASLFMYYVPYDTRLVSTSVSASSTVITYQDWSLVNMLILFLLAFTPIGFFYSIFKRKDEYKIK